MLTPGLVEENKTKPKINIAPWKFQFALYFVGDPLNDLR
jgi:hypothetical protein